MKIVIFFGLLTLISSCKTVKDFTPKSNLSIYIDSTNFKEIGENQISYKEYCGITSYSMQLKPNDSIKLYIDIPKMFAIHSSFIILQPNDEVKIINDNNADLWYSITNNEKRNRELKYYQTFDLLEKKICPKVIYSFKDSSIDKVLDFENFIIKKYDDYKINAALISDSLALVYGISEEEKYNIKLKIENKKLQLFNEMNFVYENNLKENSKYLIKQTELLAFINEIKDIKQIAFYSNNIIDFVAKDFMTDKIKNIKNNIDLLHNMSRLDSAFFGIAKDYAISRLFFLYLKNNSIINKTTLRKYKSIVKNNIYKSAVINQLYENKKYSARKKNKKTDRLISFEDSNIYTLNEILQKNKNKSIIIDYWASWCVPCRNQFKELKNIEALYKNKDVVFIHISLDKDKKAWEIANAELNLPNSYLIEKTGNQDFLNKYKIQTIPLLVFINKKGEIISRDAPKPSEIEFVDLIEKNLK